MKNKRTYRYSYDNDEVTKKARKQRRKNYKQKQRKIHEKDIQKEIKEYSY